MSDESSSTDELTSELKDQAIALGFVRAGVAVAQSLEPEGRRLREWLAAGRHGQMQWMADTAEVRSDPRHEGMLQGACSVLVLVMPYARAERAPVGPSPGRVARYARGRDYHNVVQKRAQKVARTLRRRGYQARVAVDSMPVYERAWAQRAGVGFIGKNSCLIVPGVGSHVFLSCIVTTASLSADEAMKQRCGSCRLCLDACPTDAFVEARQLDARRCVSYLTIEHRGAIPSALREGVGDWVFGCDVCQDVCPYNRTSPPSEQATAPFAPDARWDRADAETLLQMDDDQFAAWAQGSPVKRPGRTGMARNAATVLGNVGGRRHLPVLQQAAATHDAPVVREAAQWAAGRIRQRELDPQEPGDHSEPSSSGGGAGKPT